MPCFVDATGAAVATPSRPRRRRGRGINRLDPRARAAVDAVLIRLRVEGGLSYRDIESLFQSPMDESTIRRRVRRTLSRLEMAADVEA